MVDEVQHTKLNAHRLCFFINLTVSRSNLSALMKLKNKNKKICSRQMPDAS